MITKKTILTMNVIAFLLRNVGSERAEIVPKIKPREGD